ncbi:cell division ATP-binding protein FtsE [Citricoccus sp. NR2]|uniref:cell division ATP-binding protein FtsE n=1 Tax=Citricoccus sp. NR2 TaxID=3004095 RepID=UPI0022DD5B6E|nr:cell division ATP-binding protein FtsE [Citricoccus sp. NR2]WBL18673.1 cell division ATP-binding protein FtsE [Citricoccus sp. NR2]
MIRFEQVTKVYDRTSRAALDDVTVEFERGEFVFLVGASGSGKSTFIRLVLREERASHGAVYVTGRNVARLPSWRVPRLRRSIGVVFQDFRLLPNKTVFANVAFAMQVLGRRRALINQAVPDVLEMVGLAGKEKRMPHELSGGEQQRVAIARAVVNRPAILLADEPTGNLDPETSRGIMDVLDRINQNGTTVVMATHDDDIVNAMRRRVVELSDGVIVRDEAEGQYGPFIAPETDAVVLDAQSGVTLFETTPVVSALQGEPGAATLLTEQPQDQRPVSPPTGLLDLRRSGALGGRRTPAADTAPSTDHDAVDQEGEATR